VCPLLRQKIGETIFESFFDVVTMQAEAQREQGRDQSIPLTCIPQLEDGNIASLKEDWSSLGRA